MNTRFFLFAAALVVTLFSLSSVYYQMRLNRNLQERLEDANDTIVMLREDLAKQAEVLSERDKRIDKLANDKYRLSRQLQEAITREQEVRDWASTLVPPAVDSLLKGSSKPAEAGDSKSSDEMLRDSSVERK